VTRRPLRHERPRPAAPAEGELTQRQRQLYAAVAARSHDVQERLMLLLSYARTVGASSADMDAVRELLLAGHVRECSDRG